MTRLAARGVCALIYLFILAPILITIPASFSDSPFIAALPHGLSLRWYANFFATPELTRSMVLSLRLAACAGAIALGLGMLAALGLSRTRFPGRTMIRVFIMSPMIIPGLILGLAMLMFFTRTHLAESFVSLVIAHVVVTLPYAVRTLSASLDTMDDTLTEAAISLGATPFAAFRTITIPLLKAGLLASAIFTFVTSLDELVVTLFLTGPRLTTLPVEMYNYIEFTSDPTIAAISVLLIVVTSAIVLLAERTVGFADFT
jgi:putative spermidine/putrescine transport system permease protein